MTVGRSSTCNLRIDPSDMKISKVHLGLGVENGRVWIEDLNSSNGTAIIGRPKIRPNERQWLGDGDTIAVGQTRIVILLPAGSAPEDPTLLPSATDDPTLRPPAGGEEATARVRQPADDPTIVPPAAAANEPTKPAVAAPKPSRPELMSTPLAAPPPRAAAPAAVPAPVPAPPPAPEQPPPAAAQPQPLPSTHGMLEPTLLGQGDARVQQLADQARLLKARPRFVFHDEQHRTIEWVADLPFRIGRDPRSHCVLPLAQVSNDHAVLTLQADAFFLEDRKAPNRTYLYEDGLGGQSVRTALQPLAPRELRPWTRVSFAGIDAVFVAERTSANEPVALAPLDQAIAAARRAQLLDQKTLGRAKAQAEELQVHAAEILIRDGIVPAAKLLELVREAGTGPVRPAVRWRLMAGLAAIAAAIGYAVNHLLSAP